MSMTVEIKTAMGKKIEYFLLNLSIPDDWVVPTCLFGEGKQLSFLEHSSSLC